MRARLLTLSILAAILGVAGAAAQEKTLQWNGDSIEWSGTIADGRTFRIQGADGSMRVTASEDGRVHLTARRSRLVDGPLEIVEGRRGVSICVETCESDRRARWFDGEIDFVARVPASVRFNGSMIDGDVEVERLRSDVNVATIDGDVLIRKSVGFGARGTTIDGDVTFELVDGDNANFYANTIRGTIESDFPLMLDGWASPPGRPPFGSRRPLLAPGFRGGPGGPPLILQATLGKGGHELRATTIGGDIRLRRR